MKKLIYFLLFLAIGKTATAQTVSVSVADVEVVPGETFNYSLHINIPENRFKDFQYHINFPRGGFSTPDGWNSEVHPDWAGSITPGPINTTTNIGRVAGESDGNGYIPGGDRIIGSVTVKVADDMPLGEYEVTLDHFDFILDGGSGDYAVTDAISFKVKVVDVLTLVLDENSTTPPPGHFYGNVRVKRTINANEWSTICLPFDMSEEELKTAFGDDVQLCMFEGCITTTNGSNVEAIRVKFEPVTELFSNTPYIIKVSHPITEFALENRSGKTSGPEMFRDPKRIGNAYVFNKFIGTWVAETTVPERCLFISGNKFYYSKGLTKMKAFRGYFDFYDVLSGVESGGGSADAKISFSIGDGGTTEIVGTEQTTVGDAEGWFTLDGMKLNGEPTKKGIYIRNGRKIVVK